MNRKYLVLYLIAGSLALVLVVYQLITSHPNYNYGRITLDAVIALFFYYLSYKTYHEKKDDELM
jgi:hypothetical protein